MSYSKEKCGLRILNPFCHECPHFIIMERKNVGDGCYYGEDGNLYNQDDKMVMELKEKELICGKCNTLQLMTKRIICKRTSKECFCWWCPNCKDQISDSAVREDGDNRI